MLTSAASSNNSLSPLDAYASAGNKHSTGPGNEDCKNLISGHHISDDDMWSLQTPVAVYYYELVAALLPLLSLVTTDRFTRHACVRAVMA